MTHEPECPYRDRSWAAPMTDCEQCTRLRAAYQRGLNDQQWAVHAYEQGREHGYAHGYDEGRILGYKEGRQAGKDTVHDCGQHSAACCTAGYNRGYREGYNDHARSRAYAEQVYGPYSPRVLRVNEYVVNGEVYVQHGKGENP